MSTEHGKCKGTSQEQIVQLSAIALCSCRASKALEAFLRPTGLLKLAEALEEKVWVTVTIAVLITLAAAAPYFPGKCCASLETWHLQAWTI